LTPTAHLAIATRNLQPDHPLRRFLWPHVFGTQQSNYFGNMAQLVPGGDFEAIFSFTGKGLYRLMEDAYKGYNFIVTDPDADAQRRGVDARGQGDRRFDMPTERNLKQLFDVILGHTTRFVEGCYPNQPVIKDGGILEWLDKLNALIPGKTGYTAEDLTPDRLGRLLARLIYLVTAQHEMVGSFLWNYQLWTNRQPVQVYRDGRREPLDVYQRLVNYNLMLNVKRTPLIPEEGDYSYLAEGLKEPERGVVAECFQTFKRELNKLDEDMRKEPIVVWKIYPKDLEAHINA
jgi:arachidonate 15-lipoxygenase